MSVLQSTLIRMENTQQRGKVFLKCINNRVNLSIKYNNSQNSIVKHTIKNWANGSHKIITKEDIYECQIITRKLAQHD